MINYNGMRAEERRSSAAKQLPAGAYVAQVLDAPIEGKEPDQRLAILVEIYEGPYKGFYMEKFKAQKKAQEAGKSSYKVKYKGVLRLRIPNPDNKMAQYPESDMRTFNDMIAKFENSNPGVTFYGSDGFDESLLKGKLIGINVVADEYGGNAFTKIERLENVDDVRNGTVNPVKKKQQDSDPTPAPMVDQRSGMTMVETEKLPWDEDVPY